MSNEIIDKLNKQYEELNAIAQEIDIIGKRITDVQNTKKLVPILKQEKSLLILKEFVDNQQNNTNIDLHYISDLYSIENSYYQSANAIEQYKKSLENFLNLKNAGSKKNVLDAAEKIKIFEKNFVLANNKYAKEYKKIDSTEDINMAFFQLIKKQIESLKLQIQAIQNKAKIMKNSEPSLELDRSKNFHESEVLTEILPIAKYGIEGKSLTILKDIGISQLSQYIDIEIKNKGNVLISTPYENIDGTDLDSFVMAYIFSFIEAFPLGSLNIHIFDKNPSFLIRRLCNSFESEDIGESAKKIIQIHSDLSDISKFQDVICPDIFKKTSVSIPDLFSIYDNDQTDPFNLIILRNGLVDNSGYASAEILGTINALTRNGDMGHRCGLRFLIIDDSSSFEKNISASNQFQINQIRQNCFPCFQYDKSKFYFEQKFVEMIHINGNVDAYVQDRSQKIAKMISNKEKNYVSLAELNTVEDTEVISNIISIPVGTSGNSTVELPLSCKDEKGTIAGQCIGYMVIGQSGSGKSSLFHSIVLDGCMKYSPKDLQFWLLDFKFGGASSKYRNSGLPHIRIIAENNKIDDALCLFQMITEEMERRNKLFNENFVDNIIDYNRKAIQTSDKEYLPRIIIAIDEVQEIFREDNASVIQKMISAITVRMRSAGMHFIMVAQNLSEGKSYMLKESFLPSATGRVCFRVAENIPRDSGFDDEFIQRKQEITELKTGEAYISYGKGTIKRVKIAYASPDEMVEQYFPAIIEKYPEYTENKPMVIGSKKRLKINNLLRDSNKTFYDIISASQTINGIYTAIIGEDSYRMSPLQIEFSQYENSALLFLGDDKEIASSLCSSIALSLINQNVTVHLFNGDKSKVKESYQSYPHPFTYICQKLPEINFNYHNYVLSNFNEIIKNLYKEYIERQSTVQQSEDEEPEFEPIFLIVNDLFGIESFVSNDFIEYSSEEPTESPETSAQNRFDFLLARSSVNSSDPKKFREQVQRILEILIKNGYRYNIHIILSIKGDPSVWRNSRIGMDARHAVLFNTTQFTEQFENSYYLKEMLRNISNENEQETLAVWINKPHYSKIRPIIYKLANNTEKESIDNLIARGNDNEKNI